MTGYVPAPTVSPGPDVGWRLRLKFREPTWWIWAVLAELLIAGLAGHDTARLAAMAIAAGQALVWVVRHRSVVDFATQVRVAYAVWMAASLFPAFTPLFWVQAAGTTLLVLFGYCPLARMLLCLPVNRRVPLTLTRAARVFLHPPTSGSVLLQLKL